MKYLFCEKGIFQVVKVNVSLAQGQQLDGVDLAELFKNLPLHENPIYFFQIILLQLAHFPVVALDR